MCLQGKPALFAILQAFYDLLETSACAPIGKALFVHLRRQQRRKPKAINQRCLAGSGTDCSFACPKSFGETSRPNGQTSLDFSYGRRSSVRSLWFSFPCECRTCFQACPSNPYRRRHLQGFCLRQSSYSVLRQPIVD